jgi:CubicO group peptidase (beta-lactamase class C family)
MSEASKPSFGKHVTLHMKIRAPVVPIALVLAAHALLASPCRPARFIDGVPVTTCTEADPRFEAIRKELLEAVRRGDIPSASVAVIADGATVWEESIGWSDRKKRIPATANTAYLLASMGKSVTATAVMRLVERKTIDLNAPISRYLGSVKLAVHEGTGDAATVLRVLDMTAEIPHGGMSFSSLAARREYSTASLVRNRGMVVFPPGEMAMYSNMSYAVIEQMIEAVSGKSYGDFLRDELFDRLGMRHSWAGPARPDAARRYGADGAELPEAFSMPESSLSMYASIDDLLRYARLHLGLLEEQYLRPDTLATMQLHRSGAEHAPMALGIGRVDLEAGRIFLLTNGRAGGGQSALGMLARERTAAICLINSTGNRADDVIFRITDALAPGFLTQIQKRVSDYEAWSNRPFQLTPDMAGEWRGTIVTNRSKLPILLVFQPDGDVHVKVGAQLETLVNGIGYDSGLLTGTFLADVPAEEVAGHAHSVTLGLRRVGTRLSGFVTS